MRSGLWEVGHSKGSNRTGEWMGPSDMSGSYIYDHRRSADKENPPFSIEPEVSL
jgi:hypothetical protein